MKKFLCLLIAVLMLGVVAFAEAVDIDSMTDDDLLALKNQVDQAVSDRELLKSFDVCSGVYIGGVDIKPGIYKIELTPGCGSFKLALAKDSNNLDSREGTLYEAYENLREDDKPITIRFNIAEGNVMLIRSDSILKIERTDMIG